MMTTRRAFLNVTAASAAVLAGCSAVPERPTRATQYDFGPMPGEPATAAHPGLAAIALGEIDASSAFDATALLYRLAYADPNQLLPYAQARWSAPMPQLIRQRLRERLAQDRVVLDLTDSGTLARSGATMPRILRLQLGEFAQWFDSPAQSFGVLRLLVTLSDNTSAGERLVAQRNIVARRPAPTPDAPGGVQALAAAATAAADEIARWLQQQS
jgi:cholesterol transport system auxiliary component